MTSVSRVLFASGALLVSAALAQAGDHATFSPDLKSTAAAPSPTAPPAPVIAEAAPTARGKAAKRKTRLAKAKAAKVVADAAPAPQPDTVKSLTIGSIPAPLPPAHGNTEVSDAVATLEPPPAGRESASLGPREAAALSVAALLAKHAMANGVPLKLAQAVVRIESRGNAHAANHGALGLMQIKYGTARAVGFDGPAVALFVADTNLRYGMKVLAQAWRDAGGDLCGALMRYQSGHKARHMSAANRAYCSRARAIMSGA